MRDRRLGIFYGDLFLYLQSLWGLLIAAASVAALYLLGALIFLLIAPHRPPKISGADAASRPVAAAPVMAASVGAKSASAAARDPQFAANIDAAVSPVLGVLREAELEKEVLAIKAGAEIAKQINPFSLVAIAVAAGVFVGRALSVKRPLF